MSALLSKGQSYRQLLARADTAIAKGFWLEAAWIAYAIIEDRALSALEKTGGVPTSKKGTPIVMLGPKLAALAARLRSNLLLRGATIDGKVIEAASDWVANRNRLMHGLAAEAKSWAELDEAFRALSVAGRDTAAAFADAVTRLRRRLKRSQRAT
jgi:hypothetical protein